MEKFIPILVLVSSAFASIGGSGFTPSEEFSLSSGSSASISTRAPSTVDPITPCGTRLSVIIYGPVTNATTLDPQYCVQTEIGQIYRAFSHYKKKIIHEHGNLWRCYDQTPGICHTYYRQDCPGDTCLNASED